MCTRQSKYLPRPSCPPRVAGAAAQDDCKAPSSDCVARRCWNSGVTLGAGVRTNPLVHGRDIPLVVIPQFSYYGKRVFIDNLDLGVTLAESNTNSLNLVASPGYDRVFFIAAICRISSSAASAGVSRVRPLARPRKTSTRPEPCSFHRAHGTSTYLAGPEWTFKFHGVFGPIRFPARNYRAQPRRRGTRGARHTAG